MCAAWRDRSSPRSSRIDSVRRAAPASMTNGRISAGAGLAKSSRVVVGGATRPSSKLRPMPGPHLSTAFSHRTRLAAPTFGRIPRLQANMASTTQRSRMPMSRHWPQRSDRVYPCSTGRWFGSIGGPDPSGAARRGTRLSLLRPASDGRSSEGTASECHVPRSRGFRRLPGAMTSWSQARRSTQEWLIGYGPAS